MCIDNPIPFQSETPIIAYKVMRHIDRNSNVVHSELAGNKYNIGEQYLADNPEREAHIERSNVYTKGFHAYATLFTAKQNMPRRTRYLCVVEVELSELTFQGIEKGIYDTIYVANKCKFVRIVKD